jgi:type IV secretory pathway VirB9-like protein
MCRSLPFVCEAVPRKIRFPFDPAGIAVRHDEARGHAMKRIALALLACTAWIAAAAAMDEPMPTAQDSRIRTAVYAADNVIHITSTDLNPLQIVLQDGEEVASFSGLLVNTAAAPEDMKTIHDWFIQFSGNSIILKPVKQEPSTLLFVDTKAPNGTMRHYRFQLDTRDPPGPAAEADRDAYIAVNMVYPEVIEAERQQAADRQATARVRAAADRVLSGEP